MFLLALVFVPELVFVFTGWLLETADCTAAPEVLLGCGGALTTGFAVLATALEGAATVIGWSWSIGFSDEDDNALCDLDLV